MADGAQRRPASRSSDCELFEINEAFAAQVLACLEAVESDAFARSELGRDRALGEIPLDRLNVNGGAIALGHPVGSSGARLLLTLLMEMRRRRLKRGLAVAVRGRRPGSGVRAWSATDAAACPRCERRGDRGAGSSTS